MLKTYNKFINEKKKISRKGYIDANGKKIFNGHFKVTEPSVKKGKLNIYKYDVIEGDFEANHLSLLSLEGCPDVILGDFNCGLNKLKSLEGGPSVVYGNYYCDDNSLTTLNGYPKELQGYFSIRNYKQNLKTEKKYIESEYFDHYNYWSGLLMYMTKEKIDLEEVKGWPENFLTDNVKKSVKSIGKFNI